MQDLAHILWNNNQSLCRSPHSQAPTSRNHGRNPAVPTIASRFRLRVRWQRDDRKWGSRCECPPRHPKSSLEYSERVYPVPEGEFDSADLGERRGPSNIRDCLEQSRDRRRLRSKNPCGRFLKNIRDDLQTSLE